MHELRYKVLPCKEWPMYLAGYFELSNHPTCTRILKTSNLKETLDITNRPKRGRMASVIRTLVSLSGIVASCRSVPTLEQ